MSGPVQHIAIESLSRFAGPTEVLMKKQTQYKVAIVAVAIGIARPKPIPEQALQRS